MKLTISKDTTLQEIKKAFHEHYNGLKIDFFIDVNKDNKYTSDEKVMDYTMKLYELSSSKNAGEVIIANNTTVAEVEERFKTYFGVVAQIFRKRGNSWLMTTETDRHTLEQLNDMAQETSEPEKEDKPTGSQDRMELE
jgi:hypothetical protein